MKKTGVSLLHEDQKKELSETEVGELEKNLRCAAGGYYEAYPEKSLGQKGWLQNKPPGIVRRFRDILLPDVKHKKSTL